GRELRGELRQHARPHAPHLLLAPHHELLRLHLLLRRRSQLLHRDLALNLRWHGWLADRPSAFSFQPDKNADTWRHTSTIVSRTTSSTEVTWSKINRRPDSRKVIIDSSTARSLSWVVEEFSRMAFLSRSLTCMISKSATRPR